MRQLYSCQIVLNIFCIIFRLIKLIPYLLKIFQALQFILGIFQFKMGLCVKCNTYITMLHQVLQSLRINTWSLHIATIDMPAYIWRNIWHLHPVNIIIIIPPNPIIESLLPMNCHKRYLLLIRKKEAAVSIYYFFYFMAWPVLDDTWKISATSSVFCGFLVSAFVLVDSIIYFIFDVL